MRALIIGAGNAGSILANKLCQEGYEVVVIDKDSAALEKLETELDIMGVAGHGTNPDVLESAQIETMGLLAGVTNSNDVNILAGMMAKRAGVEHVVVRVNDSLYMQKRQCLDIEEMGIDRAINPDAQCARDISDMIKLPGVLETSGLLDNRVLATGVVIPEDSPLAGVPLKALPERDFFDKIRFIARVRDGELEIPFGNTSFEPGDNVYLVGDREDINTFLFWCCPETTLMKRVVIASGEGTGLELAKMLESAFDVYLIEPDPACAEHCANSLEKAVVMQGDMISREIYQELKFTDETAFIAAGPNDEDNIIACLLAKKHAASWTTALLKDPEYVPVIEGLELIDRTINSHISLMHSILQFIRGTHVLAVAELQIASGEILEIVIDAKSRWLGKKIADIHMPKKSIIATVLRGKTIYPATGALDLLEGDRLIVFATSKSVKKLRKISGK